MSAKASRSVVMRLIRAVLLSIGLLALTPVDAWAQWTVSSPNGAISICRACRSLRFSCTGRAIRLARPKK